MNKFIIVLILFLLDISCSTKIDMEQETLDMIETDREFSQNSEEHGRNEAFYTYCAKDAVMLINNSLPIKGKEKLKEEIFNRPDSNYTLVWEPLYGNIAKSCDLGYTYGIWTFFTKDEKGDEIVKKGTYCSIWEKDKNGNWKWILDTGNSGIGK